MGWSGPIVLALSRAESVRYALAAVLWLVVTVLVIRAGMRRDGRAGEVLVVLGLAMALILFFGYAGILYLRA
jgi:hypothetical protein